MPTSTSFQGRLLIAPTAVSNIDDSALNASNVVGTATVGIVGPSTGGAPNAALTFTRAADAVAALRSGALLDCVRRAFDPGAGTPGAGKVIAVRAGAPLQGTLNLQDGSAATTIALTSLDYGAWNNQIRVSVAAGTLQGKKITVAAPVGGVIQNLIGDNLYRAAFSVQYTGAGSASTMTVTTAAGVTTVATTCTGAAGDNVSFTSTNFPTMQQLVDALNATGKYTAAVLSSATEPTIDLDGATAVDIKTALYTAVATLQACIDWFNLNQPFVSAAKAASILVPNNVGFTYLASGSDGAALSNGDWSTALAVLEVQDISVECVASGSATIHGFLLTSVNNMSGLTGKRERIGLVGGVLGESVSAVNTRAASLASQRLGLVWPGIKDADPVSGVLTSYDPFVVAAAVAGVFAGGPVTDAATQKFIGAQALETIPTDAQVDTLLNAGVIPIRLVPGRGFRIVQSISTWTADALYTHVELSCRRAADYISKTVRDALTDLIGQTSGPTLLGQMSSRVNSVLRQAQFDGVLVGTFTNPAYKNVQVTLNANRVVVEYTASVGIPANYILITAHLTAFQATAQ